MSNLDRVLYRKLDSESIVDLGSGFSPLSLASFILWLDMSDTSTITESTNFVTSMADKSGSGNTLTSISGGRPVTNTETINGRNVLDFQSDDYLFNTSITTYTGTSTTGFIVAQRDSIDLGDRYLIVHNSAQADDLDNTDSGLLCVNASNDTIDLYRNNGIVSGATHPLNDTPFLFCGEFDGTNGTAYLNGTAATSGAFTTAFNYDSIYVGCGYTTSAASDFINGKIAEVLITTEVLSTFARQKIEGYLAWKWGLVSDLDASHPYKNHAPLR